MARTKTKRTPPPAAPTEIPVAVAGPPPEDVVLTGIAQLANQARAWKALVARLQTYRRLHPDRYAHVVAFCESGQDVPTDDEMAAVLRRAAEVYGA